MDGWMDGWIQLPTLTMITTNIIASFTILANAVTTAAVHHPTTNRRKHILE
jgi:hypothetical protein